MMRLLGQVDYHLAIELWKKRLVGGRGILRGLYLLILMFEIISVSLSLILWSCLTLVIVQYIAQCLIPRNPISMVIRVTIQQELWNSSSDSISVSLTPHQSPNCIFNFYIPHSKNWPRVWCVIALERTFLSYIRTANALASLSIAIYQLTRLSSSSTSSTTSPSSPHIYRFQKSVTLLMMSGAVLVTLTGFGRFLAGQKKVEKGKWKMSGFELVGVGGWFGFVSMNERLWKEDVCWWGLGWDFAVCGCYVDMRRMVIMGIARSRGRKLNASKETKLGLFIDTTRHRYVVVLIEMKHCHWQAEAYALNRDSHLLH